VGALALGAVLASDAPIEVNDDLRRVLIGLNAAKGAGERLKAKGGTSAAANRRP